MVDIDTAIRRTRRNQARIWNAYYGVIAQAKRQGWFNRTLLQIAAKYQRDRLLDEVLERYHRDCVELLHTR